MNFASMEMNTLSLFRFVVNNSAQDSLVNLFEQLAGQPFVSQAEFLARHYEDFRIIVEGLCPTAILDPFAEKLHRSAQFARSQYGLVSLAGHPYGLQQPCILAGGITGPTTSGAISLLAGNHIFAPDRMSYDGLDTRPLGGIFRRRDVSKIPPYDVLHIEEDLEWVTPAYSIEELIEKLKSMKNSCELPATHVTKDDVSRLLELVESISGSPGAQPLPMPRKVHVIILIGGLGVRMKAYTKGHSKAELPIVLRDQSGRQRNETILSILVQTLAKTSMVEDVILLSNTKSIDNHRKLGEKLARKYKIKIAVETAGGKGNADLATVLVKQLGKYSRKVDPVVLMVGDTLFSPKDIRELFEWVSVEKPLAAIACSQVYGELHRYGVIEFDRDGRIHKIWEKPGAAMYRTVSQGIYIFSPELRWRQLIANTNPKDIIDLLNMISDKVPIRSFVLNDPIYDCGSPAGYEKACANGREGKLW